MASYGYEAINKDGKEIKSSIEAESMELARTQLKQQGLIVLNIKQQTALTKDINFDFLEKVSSRDLAVFCRQFVSMERAGVSILQCLNLLREQTENKQLKKAIREAQADVEKGEPLTDGLARQEKIFPNIMVTTIAAGESSGSLDVSLERMAVQLEKTSKTESLVKKAMIYPLVVALVAVAVIIVMLVVVIPRYNSMFEELGTELPGITKAVLNISNFLTGYWFVIIPIIVLLIIGVNRFKKSDTGQRLFSKMALKLPIVKKLSVKSACSRLSRTLETLITAGVPLVEAIEITSRTMSNVLFRDALLTAKDEVIKGAPLSEPLEQSKLFPPMLYHMIRIGEESGNIEEMLGKLADYYDEEVEMATQSLMAAMEPLIILLLAGIVGVLIAAVMAPLLQLYQTLDTI